MTDSDGGDGRDVEVTSQNGDSATHIKHIESMP